MISVSASRRVISQKTAIFKIAIIAEIQGVVFYKQSMKIDCENFVASRFCLLIIEF